MSEKQDWELQFQHIDDSIILSKSQAPQIFQITTTVYQIDNFPDSQKINLSQMSANHYSCYPEQHKPIDCKKPKQPKPKLPKSISPIDKTKLLQELLLTNEDLSIPDSKPIINLLMVGHVDTGKSTLCGNILVLTGKIDPRVLAQYQQQAQQNNRQSWWLAYVMDIHQQERVKGKTLELGTAYFDTADRHYVLLDAPGHKNYVPNMITGTALADVVAIVISARQGEFQSGFNRAGQTIEHTIISKGRGVSHFLVVVTKMDTVGWDQQRFNQIKAEFSAFLAEIKLEEPVFIPISGLKGENISEKVSQDICPWYTGISLLEYLNCVSIERNSEEPLRIPIVDKFRDQGYLVDGKIEVGTLVKGLQVTIMPMKIRAQILQIYGLEQARLTHADAGSNLKIKLKLPEEIEVFSGCVICDIHDLIDIVQGFQAELFVLDLLPHKPLITSGFICVMHIHTAMTSVTIQKVEAVYDQRKQKLVKKPVGGSNSRMVVHIYTQEPVCISTKNMKSTGYFVLRDENVTLAVGRVRKY